jgi:spore germination cell wall hydrolase CwlJ-like protein
VVAGIQAKLKVGQPGDVYEQEADRVADEVMRMPEPRMQRQAEEKEEEEELIQTKPLAEQITPLVQRQEEEAPQQPQPQEEEEVPQQPHPQEEEEVPQQPHPQEEEEVPQPPPMRQPPDAVARMTFAEAGGENQTTRQAVAATILNRIRSSEFPNTAGAVVSEPLQFTAYGESRWNASADPEDMAPLERQALEASQRAAAQAQQSDPTNGAMWFHDTSIGTPNFIQRGINDGIMEEAVVRTIPNMRFYRYVGGVLQRPRRRPQPPPVRQESVQRILALATKAYSETEVAPEVEQAIQWARGGGQALDSGVRAQMESAFGADFSDVRVHIDAQADMLNRALNAHAFTTSQDIFFRQGAYNPGVSRGRKLLAHELTHVTQQTVGLRRKMTLGQPGERYEQKADPVARGLIRQEQRAGSQGKAYRPTDEEEVKEIKTKGIADILRRQAEEEEEESVRVLAESGSLRGQAERELDAVQSRKEISRLRLRSEGEKVLQTTREGYLMQQREKVRNKPEPVATQHQPEGEEYIEDPELELLLILGGKVREEYAYEDIEQLHAYLQRIQQKQPELESVLKPLLEKYFPNQGEAVWEQSQQPIASFAGRFGSLKIILYDCDSDQADFFKIQADLIANAINAVEIPSSCRPRNRTRLRLGTGGTPFTNNSITPVLERAHNCVGRRVDEVHIVGHSHQGMNFSEETSEAIGTHVSSKGRVIFHGCSVLSSDNEADLASLLEQLGSEAVVYAHAMAGEAGRPFEFYKIALPAGEDTIRKELLQKVTVILPKEYIREWAKMKIRYNKTNELYDMLSKKQELNLQRDTEEIIIQDLIELLERQVRRWSIRQLRRAYRRRLYDWEKAVIKAEITVRELAREGLLIR